MLFIRCLQYCFCHRLQVPFRKRSQTFDAHCLHCIELYVLLCKYFFHGVLSLNLSCANMSFPKNCQSFDCFVLKLRRETMKVCLLQLGIIKCMYIAGIVWRKTKYFLLVLLTLNFLYSFRP